MYEDMGRIWGAVKVDDVAGASGLKGVDFSDEKKAIAWLEKQSIEVRCAISSRAALRVCPNIALIQNKDAPLIALFVFRAILTSAVRSAAPKAEVNWLIYSMAASATADRAAKAAQSVGIYAAYSAVYAASNTARSYYSPTSAASAISFFPVIASMDSTRKNITSFLTPVWDGTAIPDDLAESHRLFLKQLASDNDFWGFWHDWYLAMWEGRFSDWDLAIEVVKIPDAVWEDGAEAVAEAIRNIEARRAGDLPRPDNVPELERSKLLKYVERLLAAPEMTALAAESAEANLERAIREYRDKAEVNQLPDELRHLESLPALFKGISVIVKSGGTSEAKITELADKIEILNGEVARLETNLKEALTKTVHGLFKQSAIKAAGAAFGGGVVGSLGLALAHFFGGWPDDFTLENLRGFLSELETATPKTENINL